jgi:hypothetical protein
MLRQTASLCTCGSSSCSTGLWCEHETCGACQLGHQASSKLWSINMGPAGASPMPTVSVNVTPDNIVHLVTFHFQKQRRQIIGFLRKETWVLEHFCLELLQRFTAISFQGPPVDSYRSSFWKCRFFLWAIKISKGVRIQNWHVIVIWDNEYLISEIAQN